MLSSPKKSPAPPGPAEVTIFVIPPQSGDAGPLLDSVKVSNLPEAFGPGPMHRVLREAVQHLVDAALDQRTVFECLKSKAGDGKVIITASFQDKMHKLRWNSYILSVDCFNDINVFQVT